MTLVEVMSLLVASGNGNRCNKYRENLREVLLCVDSSTGQFKVSIHKFGKEEYPDLYKKISREVARVTNPLVKDIDSRFFNIQS